MRISVAVSLILVKLLQLAVAFPAIKVHPGNASNIIITSQNTLNATTYPDSGDAKLQARSQQTGELAVSFINNLSSGSLNAYVTGLVTNEDGDDALAVLQPNGQYYFPTANESIPTPQAITADIAIPLGPQGSTTNITLPDFIASARVWVSEGDLYFFTVAGNGGPSLVEPSAVNPSDPSADVNWGFVELTNTQDGGLYADISYVDFVGMPLGISLTCANGPTQSAEGLSANAVTTICEALEQQGAQDGQPWSDLCMVDSAGTPLRVISPNDYISVTPSFEDYWDSYVEEVWQFYAENNLTINTQAGAGMVTCQVVDGNLACAGDNRGYSQPTASDIFGCNSGPFAILPGDNGVHVAVVPRLCASFHRSTLLLSGGDVQPGLDSTAYYTTAPTNWYSKFVHDSEVDGKGYAFAYDDVTPDGGANQAGVVADPNPELLVITIGGPSSSW